MMRKHVGMLGRFVSSGRLIYCGNVRRESCPWTPCPWARGRATPTVRDQTGSRGEPPGAWSELTVDCPYIICAPGTETIVPWAGRGRQRPVRSAQRRIAR